MERGDASWPNWWLMRPIGYVLTWLTGRRMFTIRETPGFLWTNRGRGWVLYLRRG